jgi:hypothetical protein
MNRFMCVGLLIGLLAVLGGPASTVADDPPAPKQPPKDQKPAQPPDKYAQLGQQMIKSLKESPGCLGVETAFTTSGKMVLFAWFKDKKACLDWYYSDTHQKVIKDFFPGTKPGKPLQGVPDDCGPIMAIASVTFSQKPMFEGTTLPFSQISIELYTPLKGGLSLGGSFAPPGVKAPAVTPKK